jgi:hypothetical protein
LEGLEVSEINLSELERTNRIDSEFYSRSNIIALNELLAKRALPITRFVTVSDGNHMTIREDYCDEGGVPYYRGSDIYNFFIEQASCPLRIAQSAFDVPNMRRSHLKKGDVLMSIVGAIIGNLSLVTTDAKATCSCKLAIMRPSGIESSFLAIYLKSYYGQNQIQKYKRGAAQTGLILEDFDQILIPDFSDEFRSAVIEIVNHTQYVLAQSQTTYSQAETLLLNALNLADFSLSTENTNIKSFRESFASSGRLDAEHYQPKYDQMLAVLEAYPGGATTIGSLAGQIANGAEVREYQEEGVAYLRVGDVKNLTIDASSVVRIDPASAEKGLEKIDLQAGDVLVSRSGSLAVTAVVEPEWADALISSHLIRLRITDKRIDSYYLALFLGALPGKMQIQQQSNGGVQPEINQPALKSILVPIPPQDVQKEIRRLILDARKLREASNRLLDVAKRTVEIAIEQDEAAALAYIEENMATA